MGRILWIVMEKVPGKQLECLVVNEKVAFTETQMGRILRDVLEALTCLEHHGLCHRNVHPSNVIVDCLPDCPKAHLVGFGHAIQFSKDNRITPKICASPTPIHPRNNRVRSEKHTRTLNSIGGGRWESSALPKSGKAVLFGMLATQGLMCLCPLLLPLPQFSMEVDLQRVRLRVTLVLKYSIFITLIMPFLLPHSHLHFSSEGQVSDETRDSEGGPYVRQTRDSGSSPSVWVPPVIFSLRKLRHGGVRDVDGLCARAVTTLHPFVSIKTCWDVMIGPARKDGNSSEDFMLSLTHAWRFFTVLFLPLPSELDHPLRYTAPFPQELLVLVFLLQTESFIDDEPLTLSTSGLLLWQTTGFPSSHNIQFD
ncbi:hypothetical protein Pelo_3741 [Pelomyxa schiedti]|nr:hypothetical protein Pelo_3741 [Pelomyxa schiedti]